MMAKELGFGSGALLAYYGRVTTVHGIPRVSAHDTSLYTKVFWLIIFLIASGIMTWQLAQNVQNYVERPVDVRVEIKTSQKLDFPSITVCNMNPLKKSLIRETKYQPLVDIDDYLSPPGSMKPSFVMNNLSQKPQDFSAMFRGDDQGANGQMETTDDMTAEENGLNQIKQLDESLSDTSFADIQSHVEKNSLASSKSVKNDSDFFGLLQASQTGDYSDFLDFFKPTIEDISEYGHKASDFIVTCSFDKKKCNESDFIVIPNQKLGNCFTFNHNFNRDIAKTARVGSQYGLRLTLNLETDEYVGILAPGVGARVTVHHYNTTPYPEQFGISAAPGQSTNIGIKLRRMERHELSKCYNEPEETSSPRTPSERFGYSVTKCLEACLQNNLATLCGCTDSMEFCNSTGIPYCEYTNGTQDSCRALVYALHISGDLDCGCSLPCLEFSYQPEVSTEQWPSENFAKILRERLLYSSQRDIAMLKDKNDLLSLRVFFEDLSVERVYEVESYPVEKLLSDVGGTMGLWIGISVCSFFELFEMIGTLIKIAMLQRMEHKDKKQKKQRIDKPKSSVIHVYPAKEALY